MNRAALLDRSHGSHFGRSPRTMGSITASQANATPMAKAVFRAIDATASPPTAASAARAPPRRTTPVVSRSHAESAPAMVPRNSPAGRSARASTAWRATEARNANRATASVFATSTRIRLGSHVSSVLTVPACHSAPIIDAPISPSSRMNRMFVPITASRVWT
jgi:hypothetical protein